MNLLDKLLWNYWLFTPSRGFSFAEMQRLQIIILIISIIEKKNVDAIIHEDYVDNLPKLFHSLNWRRIGIITPNPGQFKILLKNTTQDISGHTFNINDNLSHLKNELDFYGVDLSRLLLNLRSLSLSAIFMALKYFFCWLSIIVFEVFIGLLKINLFYLII